MDMLSYFENMDVLLRSENTNPIERELSNTIDCSASNNDTEVVFSQLKENSSQENGLRDFSGKKSIPRQDRLFECIEIISKEIDMRLEMDSLVHSPITDRVKPEIRNIMGPPPSSHRNTESGSSGKGQENTDLANGSKTKITKKDSRSAFDLRDTGDLSPYSRLPTVVKLLERTLAVVFRLTEESISR